MFILTSSDTNYLPVQIVITIGALFLFGSFIGYIIELLFRRFVSVKKWVNPGFLKGPWLPMYGFGLVGMFFLCWGIISIFPDSFSFYNPVGDLYGKTIASGPSIYDLLIIVILTVFMIGIEFIAGLIFVKGFKVRLWDYTNMRGNILGIICPVFNLIWFAVAILYYYAINPFVYAGFENVFKYFFTTAIGGTTHVGTIFTLGIIYGVFFVDLVKSIDLFNKVLKLAKDSGIIYQYEKLREEVRKTSDEAKAKFFDKLPDNLKKSIENPKQKNTFFEKAYEKARNAVLINPDKKDNKANYDENGRPIKED